MRILAILFCLFGLILPAAAQEQIDLSERRDEIIDILSQIPDFAPVRQELQSAGFKGENLELAVRQSELMYRDPVLSGYLADELIKGFLDPSTIQPRRGLIWPLVERGLGHLPTREMRYFYLVEQSLIRSLPNRQCGRVVRNRLSQERFAEITSKTIARLDTATLREYYRIQKKAARLGAKRKAVRLTNAQIAAVEKEIFAGVELKLKGRDDEARLRAAIADLPNARNSDACKAGKLFLETVLELEGQSLRNAMLFMSLP
ncbi:MAG: hypothetical protein AAGF53_10040 [Pseudomonadota bacterium]